MCINFYQTILLLYCADPVTTYISMKTKPKVSSSGSYSVAGSGNSQYQSSSAGVGGQMDSVDADDDIQEVVPVKTEPAAAVSHLQTQESGMPAQVEEGGYTEEGYEGHEGYATSQYADYDNSAELAKGKCLNQIYSRF